MTGKWVQIKYRESNRDGVTKKPRKREVGFSELTEKGRSLRTKKLFLRKREMVKGNLTSQLLFSWNLSKPSDLKRRQREVHAYQGKVKEK